MRTVLILKFLAFVTVYGNAQNTAASSGDSIKVAGKPEQKKKNWYDAFSIRGYIQIRYNRLFETNPDLVSEQGDKSIGNNGGFFIRRMRIIFSGDVHERVYIYIQPDLASSASSTGLHFAQLRDAYFDLSLDRKREFRFRIGQSKVPFGFENLQSSQNRLPLDRNDALNSAVANERDLGVLFYYAPENVRKLFGDLVRDGYKGSGDYGVVGIGVYNGQTANKPELNNSSHFVARLTYPFEIGSQIIEPSVQMYTGMWSMAKDQLSAGTKMTAGGQYVDERYAGTFVLYPRPFGIQAEYNIGKGPQYDVASDSVVTRSLSGGYVTLSYLIRVKNQFIFPFVRGTIYDGGKKHEADARSYSVREFEGGIEWQPVRNFELVASWMYSDRTTSDRLKENNYQFGSLLRLQAQLNF